MAQELSKAYDPNDVEDRIYAMWEGRGYFHALPDCAKKPYVIVIPPPNITGILHMGHALNNTIQDILIRYKRMRGFAAEWMPGTDHAGIATQNVVEKKLLKEGKKRQDLGREAFVREVWRWRDEYGSTIIRQLKKLGCSCDWERTRFTMDERLSGAVLEVFVRLYEKGLIYRGNYIINWCPRCQTALSDEEAQHRDLDGMLYYIKYPVSVPEGAGKAGAKTELDHVIVATTRPETMLGDVAIAVNPKDKRYKHLKHAAVTLPLIERKLTVIFDPVVDMSFGTGALKVTPAHDPVDFELGRRHGLEPVNVMTDDGFINALGGKYAGMERFEARAAIVEDLKERGLFVKSEPHRHAVGHCYRCHTVVEPRLSPQWFVKMKPLAREAIDVVRSKKIRFHPVRWTKVYLNWMENIKDWCISRQIWWGHRLPVYYCSSCYKKDAAPSGATGESASKGIIVSKARPERCPDCGSTELEQDPDVLDTWFSSWLWPFSTFGWPAENEDLKYFYPTDALVTAQEIIFFWVARMIMAGLEFMGDVPFRNVYIHGTVRDDSGTKMSKSLGNVIDPLEMIRKYGTDALRFSIISITAQGQDVFLSESKFERGRNFANKIWNAARFIHMNLKEGTTKRVDRALWKSGELDLADRWILSRCKATISAVEKALDKYRFNDAANAVYEFLWHEFCDWYIEISKGDIQAPAKQAVLYTVLETSLALLHPFMPFITEEIWQSIPHEGESIMVRAWPSLGKEASSKEAEAAMARVIEVVVAIRNLRAEWNVEPARRVEAIVSTDREDIEKLLRENVRYITALGRLSELKVGRIEKPSGTAVTVLSDLQVFLPLAGMVDFDKERGRIASQIQKLDQELSGIGGRLKDAHFLSKAPADVVEKQKARQGELAERRVRLEANMKDLQG